MSLLMLSSSTCVPFTCVAYVGVGDDSNVVEWLFMRHMNIIVYFAFPLANAMFKTLDNPTITFTIVVLVSFKTLFLVLK